MFMVAAGLTLTFGALRIINLAHGSFYMLGAYFAYALTAVLSDLPGGFMVALVVAPVMVAAVGAFVERGLLRRIYRGDHLYQVVLTFAVLLVVSDAVLLIWGVDYKRVEAPSLLRGSFLLGSFGFPRYLLLVLGLAPLLAAGLWFLLYRTRSGRLIRAVVQDREMAEALGINVSRLFTLVFMLGCWLAGLGGTLVAPLISVDRSMDLGILLDAFIIVVIGGMGSFGGALVGGIILGQLQAFATAVPALIKFAEVFPFLLMALILLVRPQGLFGHERG